MRTRGIVTAQLVFGVSLLVLGGTIILDRLGILEARQILRFWPVVLIASGANVYFQADRGSKVGGLVMMAVGAWLLLAFTHILPFRSFLLFWPLMMVIGGGALIVQALRRSSEPAPARIWPGPAAWTGTGPASQGGLRFVGIMGGGKRTSDANPFLGAELMSIMGGGMLDLRRAVIPPGEQATIEIFSLMGGFEILVPDTWTIEDRVLPFMGAVQNDTRPIPVNPAPKLILRGFVMMGGVHLK